jgi:hypothetical protein
VLTTFCLFQLIAEADVEREVINLYEEDSQALKIGMCFGLTRLRIGEHVLTNMRQYTEFDVVEMDESEIRRIDDDEDEEDVGALGEDLEDECVFACQVAASLFLFVRPRAQARPTLRAWMCYLWPLSRIAQS